MTTTNQTTSNPVNMLTGAKIKQARNAKRDAAPTVTDTVLPTTDVVTNTEAPTVIGTDLPLDVLHGDGKEVGPIAQALLDQGKALATSAEATSNAHQSAKQTGESLASKCRAVIELTDTEAQHVIVQAMADLKTLALSTMGCPVGDATPDQLVASAAHCLASFKVLSATLKRANTDKAGKASHGLLYMSLDRQTCDATVKVITAPTEAELRQALKDDTKALNAALAAAQAKADSAKAMAESGDDSAQGEDGHVVIGSGVSSITALAAVLELVKGWRPSELEVAAATLTHMALCERLARDADNAELKAQVDAARLSVTLLTSAYQSEKAAELVARNEAQAKQEAELLALRTENARKAREALLAEEAALAKANEAMAARMAASQPTPVPVCIPTDVTPEPIAVNA